MKILTTKNGDIYDIYDMRMGHVSCTAIGSMMPDASSAHFNFITVHCMTWHGLVDCVFFFFGFFFFRLFIIEYMGLFLCRFIRFKLVPFMRPASPPTV